MHNADIIALMYHEISKTKINKNTKYKMAPLYDISEEQFSRQMKFLYDNNYHGISVEEVNKYNKSRTPVVLTFDDGWRGNYENAFKILLKYNFSATFFVTINFLDTPGFMSWKEVEELSNNGMSVQSHCVSHKPLIDLDEKSIKNELDGSMKTIENRILKKVRSVSFPHGAYNKEIIKIANDIGYKYLCTSDITISKRPQFNQKRVIIGRYPIKDNLTQNKFVKIIKKDKKQFIIANVSKKAKNAVKKIIGIKRYRKIYRAYFDIVVEKDQM